MQLSQFHYDLPPELIARYPTEKRTASRLLCLEGKSGAIQHKKFIDILDLIEPGDLLILNNTKVIPARLFGHKQSGGKVEILIERLQENSRALVHLRASKTPKPGSRIMFADVIEAEVIAQHDNLFELQFPLATSLIEILEQHGHMPLPPYMQREDEQFDRERYQTIYADIPGAVAAPTAGLHFDDEILAKIREKNVQIAFVTLHVGAGTFQPVRVENITEHKMHKEYIEISAEVCELIRQTKARGKRVIAVGTTSLRCLETAALSGEIKPYQGDTQIFIYPGFEFHCVDVLITNFHLPQSTLLMLVSAFAGLENVLKAYQIAIQQQYRFFSYGDAMWMTRTA